MAKRSLSSTWKNRPESGTAFATERPRVFSVFREKLTPGDGNVKFPFAAHIVVRGQALVFVLLAQGSGTFEPHLLWGQVNAAGEAHVFREGLLRFGVGGIEKIVVVD